MPCRSADSLAVPALAIVHNRGYAWSPWLVAAESSIISSQVHNPSRRSGRPQCSGSTHGRHLCWRGLALAIHHPEKPSCVPSLMQDRSLVEQPFELKPRPWGGEKIALPHRAAQRLHDRALGLRLDPFRDNADVQRRTEFDDALHNDALGHAVGHAVHETAINLDLAERKALQIAKIGISSAEVVDRDPDAQAPQVLERPG